MKTEQGFCCCRGCKRVFENEADYILHLGFDGYCRGGVDRAVRDLARIIMFSCR